MSEGSEGLSVEEILVQVLNEVNAHYALKAGKDGSGFL